jgi:hypothetical protein
MIEGMRKFRVTCRLCFDYLYCDEEGSHFTYLHNYIHAYLLATGIYIANFPMPIKQELDQVSGKELLKSYGRWQVFGHQVFIIRT